MFWGSCAWAAYGLTFAGDFVLRGTLRLIGLDVAGVGLGGVSKLC